MTLADAPQGSWLHLGCGSKRVMGMLNTDVRPECAVDAVVDAVHTPLPARRFGGIYASHLLEHVYRDDTVPTLVRWREALVEGGTLLVSVPDLRLVLANCIESHKFGPNPDAPLFGDYRETQEDGSPVAAWDRHKRCFTVEILTAVLQEAGFVDVRRWSTVNMPQISRVKDYASNEAISLNLAATRRKDTV